MVTDYFPRVLDASVASTTLRSRGCIGISEISPNKQNLSPEMENLLIDSRLCQNTVVEICFDSKTIQVKATFVSCSHRQERVWFAVCVPRVIGYQLRCLFARGYTFSGVRIKMNLIRNTLPMHKQISLFQRLHGKGQG